MTDLVEVSETAGSLGLRRQTLSLGIGAADTSRDGTHVFRYFYDRDSGRALQARIYPNGEFDHTEDFEGREALEEAVRAESEPPPDAAWTTTPRELIRNGSAPIYLSTTPDVALTPRGSATPPIPYDTWARPTNDLAFSANVRATRQNVMIVPSSEQLTFGAEQGLALGVTSGTIMGPVNTLERSTTVRANGQFVIRDGDQVWMNNYNNLGVARLEGSTMTTAPANDNSPPEEEPGLFGRMWNGAGDAWDATKQAASDAAAAIGEFDRNHGRVLTRGVGAVQAVGGVVEALGGAALVTGGGAATATGVGAAPGIPAMAGGALLWVNGWDNAITGARTAWNGEFQQTMASQAAGGVAQALGADPATVRQVENTTDLASGALSIAGSLATGPRVLAREGLEAGARQLDDVAEEGAGIASRQVDEVVEATPLEQARVTRPVPLRRQYLGSTPGKTSGTGKAVRERMREEGTLRTDPWTGADEFLDEAGTWRPVDSPQTHMGHHPVDAVDYWNDVGRYSGARSDAVNAWMRDPDNYRFEWGPLNSARGGATTSRYQPPVPGPP